jgi:hypothetical protein
MRAAFVCFAQTGGFSICLQVEITGLQDPFPIPALTLQYYNPAPLV